MLSARRPHRASRSAPAPFRRRRRGSARCARVAVGSTKMRSRSPGGRVNSSAPSSAHSRIDRHAGRRRAGREGTAFVAVLLVSRRACRRRRLAPFGAGVRRRGTAVQLMRPAGASGAAGGGAGRGGAGLVAARSVAARAARCGARRLNFIDELQAREFDVGGGEVLAIGRGLRLRGPGRLGGSQDLVGARFHLERGFAGRRFAGRGKALASSARRASALNTSPHRPQRTWPPAARSVSAVSWKTVSQLEHCVYKLGDSPSVDAAPIAALNHLHDSKSSAVRGLYCIGLALQQAGQEQIRRPARRPRVNTGANSIKRIRQNVRQHAGRRARAGRAATPCDLELGPRPPLRAALSRVARSACGSRSTATTRAAPSFRAAMPRMPEPQP